MTAYDFEQARREWSKLPDDIDYFDPGEWLSLDDEELREKAEEMERHRYLSWRNPDNQWRAFLGLDDTHDKTVLDFGCGTGIEALQFAKAGNQVLVADINRDSTHLAQRLLEAHGYTARRLDVFGEEPWVVPPGKIDVFYANGVLHHTPHAPAILRRAAELLEPDGEVRLMLYSDRGWKVATQTGTLPLGDPRDSPYYERFLRFFDSVGVYSEPWWAGKLAFATEGFLELSSWRYLCADGRFAVARLRLCQR